MAASLCPDGHSTQQARNPVTGRIRSRVRLRVRVAGARSAGSPILFKAGLGRAVLSESVPHSTRRWGDDRR